MHVILARFAEDFEPILRPKHSPFDLLVGLAEVVGIEDDIDLLVWAEWFLFQIF